MVHVSIKGVPILGNVKIIQNTGVKRENTLNFIKGQLTTGKIIIFLKKILVMFLNLKVYYQEMI